MPKGVKECEERGFHSFRVKGDTYECENCGEVLARWEKDNRK